ncbi:MAG TPA: hypothetical protein VGN89_03385 [Phenylobacterium sp.]|jgi:hypothetical protein|nr:hypothetical protein [Phenylobacterium sp.]
MKLPLIAVVLGLLAGIAAVMWIGPRTPGGTALILFVSILVMSALVLAAGKVASWFGRPRH